MPELIFSLIMGDGSRHFAGMPEEVSWYDLRDHITTLEGAEITNFVTDEVLEVWIEFTYAGHEFSINNQYGEYWFFVNDPRCPESILQDVLTHCERILER